MYRSVFMPLSIRLIRAAPLVEYIGLRALQTSDLTVRNYRGPCLRYFGWVAAVKG